jgi:hypothetical protein
MADLLEQAFEKLREKKMIEGELYPRGEGQELTPRQSNDQVGCIYCGYRPGFFGGRLAILIVDGTPCFCCLACEVRTMEMERVA